MFIGGLVRSTGSGMGCPDWPKCFGAWIPPTVESQLPADYQVIYKDHLTKYGSTFNVTKTWTEYLNRLFGVLTGFFILGSAITSLKFRKTNKLIPIFSFIGLILVGFQGWLGGKVVHSNLSHSMVTIHFLIAFLIIAIFTFCYIQLKMEKGIDPRLTIQPKTKYEIAGKNILYKTSILLMILLISQIILGTKVRTEIDMIASQIDTLPRSEYAESAKENFPTHRTISLFFTVCLGGYLYFKSKEKVLNLKSITSTDSILLYSTLGQMIIGTTLYKFGFPYWAQPLHIILSSFMFGALSYIILSDVSNNLLKSNQTDVILQSN